jgi:hypothetical protein
MGAREAPERLAKPSVRKQAQTRDRLARVEADEVEIAADPTVLESVVEKEEVRAQTIEEIPTSLGPVGTYGDREASDSACQLEGLVAGVLGRREDAVSVGDQDEGGFRPPAVATRQHRHALAAAEELARQRRDERGLSASPDGEVPYTHHLCRKARG